MGCLHTHRSFCNPSNRSRPDNILVRRSHCCWRTGMYRHALNEARPEEKRVEGAVLLEKKSHSLGKRNA